ncbi:MAG: urease accessory UreF family protein [Roseobacter sp.]|jgi:urease accessory protein|nr:urease accessory UreF family protein [Roseobacter sp.]
MTTNAYLTLTQWFSPGFPVGAFAYSHGLEQAIDQGAIADAETLQVWLEDVIAHGSARNDVILLAAAFDADTADLPELDATARALAASKERLTETLDQGSAFARTVDAIWATGIGALSYPVAVGRAARLEGLPLDMTAQIYMHAFAANLVSVAVRLVPLGQTEGQAVLAALAPLIRDTARTAMGECIDDIASRCFALDIAAMRHETQYSKVFRT